MSTPATPRSVQNSPSETALATTLLRAFATLDERPEIRGSDLLARLFLTADQLKPLDDPAARKWILQNKTSPGVYEYMLARTAYFDRVVKTALSQSVPQVVFLGAGYDSRPYRFSDLAIATTIFELDAAPTQARKREILDRAAVVKPAHLTYMPIDFSVDSLSEVLLQAGFNREAQALFVWEGVTYYLTAQAVDATLAAIKTIALPGSTICFDYAALSSETLRDENAAKLREHMKSNFAAEPTRFGVPRGHIAEFLSARGYTVLDHLGSAEIVAQFLTLHDGTAIGQPPALFSLVHAALA
ncbi:MAG: SAM-dependent methyltransferase [Anaerolineae bacterium]